MTNLFIHDAFKVPHVEDVIKALQGSLPAPAVLAPCADAEIILAVDGLTLSAPLEPWLLVWSDGSPFAALQGLQEAVCCSAKALELDIITRDGSGMSVKLRHAAFMATPGDFLPQGLPHAAAR